MIDDDDENVLMVHGELDFCMTSFNAAIADPRTVLCWEGKTQTCVLAAERKKEKK